ncbi:MAG: hypothetical protein AAFP90_17940, partial [Planctomycetota bacterium]
MFSRSNADHLERRRLRLLVFVFILGWLVCGGCVGLRLPAIDPTGERIFAPSGTTTNLVAPGSNGEGCLTGNALQGAGDCLGNLGDAVGSALQGTGSCLSNSCLAGGDGPNPIFDFADDPAPCASLAATPMAPPVCGPDIGDCKTGPPAVLYGSEMNNPNWYRLPNRGKRGGILLSPQRIVAPVGGEVLLTAGLCGVDGYLLCGEPIEWMLTPQSVGTIIDVGDDDPGLLHRLASIPKVDKRAPDFARGVTSTKPMIVTRGNRNPADDVRLQKGQTWMTLSSPTEGVSRVTLLAPESDCWDQRRANVTIYWIDARWQFPGPIATAAGTPAQLTTRVTRSEGEIPATDWIVRYTIIDPTIAAFENGSAAIDQLVDASGNAVVTLHPLPGRSGTTPVQMQVIRPADAKENVAELPLGTGRTTVTWNAAQLTVNLNAPPTATPGVTFPVNITVSNPGNEPARGVTLSMNVPPGARASAAEAAQLLTDGIVWELPDIGPGQALDLSASLQINETARLTAAARSADGQLFAEDVAQIDVTQQALSVRISPIPRGRSADGRDLPYQSGLPIDYRIEVTNTSQRPISDVAIQLASDAALQHSETKTR